MADLNDQFEGTANQANTHRKSQSGLWFGIAVIFLILAFAGAGFYLLMQLRDSQTHLGGEVQKEMTKKIADYQAQLTAIQEHLSTLEATIANKDDHFTQQLDELSKRHGENLTQARKELSDEINRLQRQLGKTRGDWLIADAEYLLGAANERLQLVGDVTTARSALEAADQRLRESGDAAVFKVREAIAKEIASLAKVESADIVGLYSALKSLQDDSEKLTLLLPYAGKALDSSPEVHSHNDGSHTEHELLQFAMEKLEGIVTIRHTDQPIKETLTPEQAQFIREQLRAKLETVKVALVQQNETLYHAGLEDAKKWTQVNFSPNPETRKFIAEVDRFLAIHIRSHFPDISTSLKLLSNITKLRIDTDKLLESGTSKTKSMEPPAVAPSPPPSAPSAPAASSQPQTAKP